MTTISLDDIQRDLLTYLQRVAAGETLVIVQADKPLAELKPVSYDAAAKQLRPIGLGAGDFTVPDDFDAPLPEDLLASFEGR
jgi:antitoxin (DNA-binding transcriptional repressor) of toxin-antitoxin stability system